MEALMPHPNLADLARRPAQYWNIDGLPELMVGVLWMVWGGAWLIGQTVPHDWRWNAYWLIVPPTLALSAVAATWATRRLKERVTFPRAGYVAWNQPDRRTRFLVAATVVVAASALALLVLTNHTRSVEQTMPAVISVILSLSFVAAGLKQRAPHHLGLAAVAVALGLAVGSMKTGWDSMNWLFVALGAACALVGAVRLARFLRAHPISAVEGL
jgi:hypothetical protein